MKKNFFFFFFFLFFFCFFFFFSFFFFFLIHFFPRFFFFCSLFVFFFSPGIPFAVGKNKVTYVWGKNPSFSHFSHREVETCSESVRGVRRPGLQCILHELFCPAVFGGQTQSSLKVCPIWRYTVWCAGFSFWTLDTTQSSFVEIFLG